MKKKTKEKPKGKLCPVLSKMFYIKVLLAGETYTIPDDPKLELRTAVWHRERDKCEWWIQKVHEPTGSLKDPIDLNGPQKTGLGWCGGMSIRGPAS